MAACSSRALPCSGILSLHQHPHHLNVSQRASAALLTKPSRRLGAALRLAASASSTAATSSAGSSTSNFVQLYAGLAGVLAPGGAVAARPTPLGRGLVAEQPAAKGDALLSGKLWWPGMMLDGMMPLYHSHAWPCASLTCPLPLPPPRSGLGQHAVCDRPAQDDRQRLWAALPGGLADAARPAAAAAAALPARWWVVCNHSRKLAQ